MAAALLTSPMAIAFVLAVALASGFALTRVWHPSPLTKQQLALGYLGVVVVCLIVAAVSAYVSPEDAVQRWHIPRDQYWASLFRTFALLSVVLTCLSILGVAVIFSRWRDAVSAESPTSLQRRSSSHLWLPSH